MFGATVKENLKPAVPGRDGKLRTVSPTPTAKVGAGHRDPLQHATGGPPSRGAPTGASGHPPAAAGGQQQAQKAGMVAAMKAALLEIHGTDMLAAGAAVVDEDAPAGHTPAHAAGDDSAAVAHAPATMLLPPAVGALVGELQALRTGMADSIAIAQDAQRRIAVAEAAATQATATAAQATAACAAAEATATAATERIAEVSEAADEAKAALSKTLSELASLSATHAQEKREHAEIAAGLQLALDEKTACVESLQVAADEVTAVADASKAQAAAAQEHGSRRSMQLHAVEHATQAALDKLRQALATAKAPPTDALAAAVCAATPGRRSSSARVSFAPQRTPASPAGVEDAVGRISFASDASGRVSTSGQAAQVVTTGIERLVADVIGLKQERDAVRAELLKTKADLAAAAHEKAQYAAQVAVCQEELGALRMGGATPTGGASFSAQPSADSSRSASQDAHLGTGGKPLSLAEARRLRKQQQQEALASGGQAAAAIAALDNLAAATRRK